MSNQDEPDNVVFIFDDPKVKKRGALITVACPDCSCDQAVVLHSAQQPFFEDCDEPSDVISVLLIQCKGERCYLLGLVEQVGSDSFSRLYPADLAPKESDQ
jgi:hypothetical protein